MIEENQIHALEDVLQNREYELQAHAFGHFSRTAKGTDVFIQTAEKETKNLAYVVGLLHEEREDRIEETLLPIGLSHEDVSKVIYSVHMTHKKSYVPNRVARAVHYSNKILEGDGAYIVFRRCHFCGESKKYRGWKATDAITERFRNLKNKPNNLPLFTEILVREQIKWSGRFLEAIESKEAWALDMGERLFLEGRARNDIENVVRRFETKTVEQEKFFKETLDYIEGKKYEEFKNLVFPEIISATL